MLLPINTMPPCCGELAPYSEVDPLACARAAIGTPADAERKTARAPANKARRSTFIENNVARMGSGAVGTLRFRSIIFGVIQEPRAKLHPLKNLEHPAGERLQRVIGPWGLALTAVNLAIGAGIFLLPAILASMLGSAAVLAHLVCGAATALVMTCFIELSSEVSRTGGPLAALEEILGPWP